MTAGLYEHSSHRLRGGGFLLSQNVKVLGKTNIYPQTKRASLFTIFSKYIKIITLVKIKALALKQIKICSTCHLKKNTCLSSPRHSHCGAIIPIILHFTQMQSILLSSGCATMSHYCGLRTSRGLKHLQSRASLLSCRAWPISFEPIT